MPSGPAPASGPTSIAGRDEASPHATTAEDEFLDIAAHELRTPLASITGFTSALLADWDEQDDAWKRGLVERVLRNARHMNELIERLLDVSRLQAGRVHLKLTDVDLAHVLEGLVDDLQPLADRDVQVVVEVEGALRTDRSALGHVVTNLLTNAAKYSDAPAPIQVTARRDREGVAVAVLDHGVGIAEGDIPHLFEHFYRGTNQGQGRGAGVGLSVAAAYVKLLGGDIHVESTPGEGSTFTAWLPDVPPDDEHA